LKIYSALSAISLSENADFTQQKNIQGLPITEHVNYDFVKATTPTDLLAFFCRTFFNLSFLSFSTFTFSSFFSLHKYLGRSSLLDVSSIEIILFRYIKKLIYLVFHLISQ